MFHDLHWTRRKIAARLELIRPLVHRRRVALPPFRYLALEGPGAEPPLGTSEGTVIEPHAFWGPPRQDFLLWTTASVPDDFDEPVLYLPFGDSGDFSHPEALVYLDGRPWAGCDRHHQEIPVPAGEHRLELHGWTGMGGDWEHTDHTHRLQMRPCWVAETCPQTRRLVARARVALGLAEVLDEHDPAMARLLNALYEAFLLLDTRDPLGERFYASVETADRALADGVAAAGPSLPVDVVAAGHAHIDVGWLWPVDQTRRKAGRTFHTVDRMMDLFPGYHFTQSQPHLYEMVRRDYPELFERIKERVREGRWEPIGGMWVEADANLSGAEALVRQMVLGRSFFREHFGEAESPVLWLPDVFGYTWSLPQLIREAGLEYFFTIKIGWSQYNRMPVDSFWWQGIDGTRVLTHFSTAPDPVGIHAATYNAVATPSQFLGTWRNFQHKEAQDILLMAFGHGDGGGGPTREMLENLEMMASAPSCPVARLGRVGDFFREMEARSGGKLPVWKGELYLEYHRGTYTTQAALKRGNRKAEVALHTLEFLEVLAGRGPDPRVREAWRLLCLNQFHDILPGSSIGQVNREARQDYESIQQTVATLQEELRPALGERFGGDLLLLNPTSFPRRDPVPWEVPEGHHLADAQGRPVLSGGGWVSAPVPSYGVAPLSLRSGDPPPVEHPVSVSEGHLENRFLRVDFEPDGGIARLYDKVADREILPPGRRGNELQLFEDRPLQWDAWDVDIFYEERQWSFTCQAPPRVVERGPLVASVETVYTTGSSRLVQTVRLGFDSPRLDFVTRVEWRERHTLLKAAFPVEVLAPTAAYEIQWGHVHRPTHRNTSWDWARFECPAHKWVDLSEGDYGVSLLNDCKYGHDVSDG